MGTPQSLLLPSTINFQILPSPGGSAWPSSLSSPQYTPFFPPLSHQTCSCLHLVWPYLSSSPRTSWKGSFLEGQISDSLNPRTCVMTYCCLRLQHLAHLYLCTCVHHPFLFQQLANSLWPGAGPWDSFTAVYPKLGRFLAPARSSDNIFWINVLQNWNPK